jgi:hypothetical protein
MNIELLKTIETQLLVLSGMLTLKSYTEAQSHIGSMIAGVRLITNACEQYPMTLEELEQEFELRKQELLR